MRPQCPQPDVATDWCNHRPMWPQSPESDMATKPTARCGTDWCGHRTHIPMGSQTDVATDRCVHRAMCPKTAHRQLCPQTIAPTKRCVHRPMCSQTDVPTDCPQTTVPRDRCVHKAHRPMRPNIARLRAFPCEANRTIFRSIEKVTFSLLVTNVHDLIKVYNSKQF